MRFVTEGMLQPPTGIGTPQGFASAGLGSTASVSLREMVGRMFSSTVSFSLICGTTVIRNPTGTELTVVVYVTIGAARPFDGVIWDEIRKYTRLSTTFSTAVWLFSTLNLGLDSTRTSPKDSSSFKVPARFSPGPVAKLTIN